MKRPLPARSVLLLFCTSLSRTEALATSSSSSSSSHVSVDTALHPVLARWVAIGKHLQNPALYSAKWANHVRLNFDDGENNVLVTRHDVQRGQILSLVPMENLQMVQHTEKDGGDCDSGAMGRDEDKHSGPCYSFSPNLTRPYEYHRASGLTSDVRIVVQAPFHDPASTTPGWMGHCAAKDDSIHNSPNCGVVPLLGALPLCALVATQEIPSDTPLLLHSLPPCHREAHDAGGLQDLAFQVLKQYKAEVSELRSYMAMAHPFPTYEPPADLPPMTFHAIDTEYPGLQTIHDDPKIYKIKNFLTADECQAIIDWATPRLSPCLVKNAETGRVEADPTRTSTNANIPQSAIPTVTAKVCQLLQCPSLRHLEIFQVLRYTTGQTFVPHTDGFDGPIDACGFEQSGRLVTLFCYLNTMMAAESGGETRFTKLPGPLSVAPEQGQAVIHFPNSIDLQEDVRTEHESVPVVQGEKWLFVTWCWKHARADPAYHEALLE